MKKYVTIIDFRGTASYKNIAARLVYLHAALHMELESRNYTHSLRALAAELGLSVQNVRTALKVLQQDNLIEVTQVTHTLTQNLTRMLTQPLTQIHVMNISELDDETNTATNTAANTATNTAANTFINNNVKNKNNKNNNTLSLTRAKEICFGSKEILMKELEIEEPESDELIETFLRRAELKEKGWESEGDCIAHLLSWCEKRVTAKKKQPKGAKSRPLTDEKARSGERQRTEKEIARQSEIDKMKDRILLAKEDYARALKVQDANRAKRLKEYAAHLIQDYHKLLTEGAQSDIDDANNQS